MYFINLLIGQVLIPAPFENEIQELLHLLDDLEDLNCEIISQSHHAAISSRIKDISHKHNLYDQLPEQIKLSLEPDQATISLSKQPQFKIKHWKDLNLAVIL